MIGESGLYSFSRVGDGWMGWDDYTSLMYDHARLKFFSFSFFYTILSVHHVTIMGRKLEGGLVLPYFPIITFISISMCSTHQSAGSDDELAAFLYINVSYLFFFFFFLVIQVVTLDFVCERERESGIHDTMA